MELGQALREAYVQRTETEWVRRVGQALDIAMTPFHPGLVTVEVNQHHMEPGRLIVRTTALPENPLTISHHELQLNQIYDLDSGLLYYIFERFQDHFQTIRMPVDDNIELGEN